MVKISKVDDIRKYTIKEKFDSLTYADRSTAIEEACQRMNISESHLRKIWSYKISSSNEARPSQLQIIAEMFQCSIEDLFTEAKLNESN